MPTPSNFVVHRLVGLERVSFWTSRLLEGQVSAYGAAAQTRYVQTCRRVQAHRLLSGCHLVNGSALPDLYRTWGVVGL